VTSRSSALHRVRGSHRSSETAWDLGSTSAGSRIEEAVGAASLRCRSEPQCHHLEASGIPTSRRSLDPLGVLPTANERRASLAWLRDEAEPQ
jgi:hypothetical protein